MTSCEAIWISIDTIIISENDIDIGEYAYIGYKRS